MKKIFILFFLFGTAFGTKYFLPVPITSSNGRPILNADVDLYQNSVKIEDCIWLNAGRYYYEDTTVVTPGTYDIYVDDILWQTNTYINYGAHNAELIATTIQDSISFPTDTLALKLLNMDEGRVAYLKDPPGWWTVIDSTYDESFCIIAAPHPTQGKQWARDVYHIRKVIYSSWTHAKGDNSNDDAQELRDGFDLMANACEFIVTSDTFLIGDSLSIKHPGIYNFNNAVINVDTSSFFPKANDNSNVIYIRSDDVTINDIKIQGNYDVKRGLYAHADNTVSGLTIDNAHITGCQISIRFDIADDIRIENCNIIYTDSLGWGISALYNNNDDNWIINNKITCETPIGVSSTLAYSWEAGHRNHIIGNHLFHPVTFEQALNSVGIAYTTYNDGIIKDNFIGEKYNHATGFRIGISVQGDTLVWGSVSLINNKIYHSTTTPLEIYEQSHAKIMFNTMWQDSGTCTIRNPYNMLIEGNTTRNSVYSADVGIISGFNIWADVIANFDNSTDTLEILKIINNTIIGGGDGIYINPHYTGKDIIISKNQIDSVEWAITFGSAATDCFDRVIINGNISNMVKNKWLRAAEEDIGSLTITDNIVVIDTTGHNATLTANGKSAFINLAQVNRLIMTNNQFKCNDGIEYAFAADNNSGVIDSILYGIISDNIFEGMDSTFLYFRTTEIDTAGNIYIQ